MLEPIVGRPEAFTIKNRTDLRVGPSDSFSVFARLTPPDPPPLFTAVLAGLGPAAVVTKRAGRTPLAGWGLLISPLLGGIVGIVGDGRRQALVAHQLPPGRFTACLILDRSTHLLTLYVGGLPVAAADTTLIGGLHVDAEIMVNQPLADRRQILLHDTGFHDRALHRREVPLLVAELDQSPRTPRTGSRRPPRS